jgi:hypothetical protein
MSAYVESTLAAALKSLDRACDAEGGELMRHLLVAREQILAARDLIAVERHIQETWERADAYADTVRAPLKLRVVKP